MSDNDDLKKFIFNKYQIKQLIHSSGFADVYEGMNEKEHIPVAMKLEKRKSKFNILKSEAFLLVNLKGYGIPKIITYGHHGPYNVLIEELLGKSIGDIYESIKSNKLNLKDVCMVALQSLDRLEYIHSKLVIHRDIKPHNLVIGKNDPNVIYLIDFGLSRKYRSSRTGKHIKFNNLKLTYGSLRYLSINGNKGYEQSRRDDLESLGYMLIFLATGNVPWLKVENVNLNIVKKYLLIYKIKKSISPEKLCKGLPEEMTKYINYCRGLFFEEDPDYNYLRGLFESMLIKIHQKNDFKFSWLPRTLTKKLEEAARNESKNKNMAKRSVSPYNRLYNKIKTNLEKTKNKTELNVQKQNLNIGSVSFFDKPLNFLYKDNEDNTNDNININNINNEPDNSITDGDYKNIGKIKKNMESESTREKDINNLNTDKSLSASFEKKERNKFKKNKDKIFFYKYNTNKTAGNDEENILKNEIEQKNIQIIDDDEKKFFEFNYQTTKFDNNDEFNDEFEPNAEINELYNNICKDIINLNNKKNIEEQNNDISKSIKTKIIQNEEQKNNNQKYKGIKFISNNNFWDNNADNVDINDESYKFCTYNNIDLKYFDIWHYPSNKTANNKNIKKKNLNYINSNNKNILDYHKNKMLQKININLNNNIQNYQVINKNNFYTNNNLVESTVEKTQKQKLIMNQKKNINLKSTKSQVNENKNNYQINKSIKKIVPNLHKNKFQNNKNEITSFRTSKEKNYNYIPNHYNLYDNYSISQIPFSNQNFLNMNIFYERKTRDINNKMRHNNLFRSSIGYDDIY